MHLNLPLSPDAEFELRKQAAQAGESLETFVANLIEQSVAEPNPAGATTGRPLQSVDERRALLQAIANRHPHPGLAADSSRETIYAERGR